MSVRKMTTMAVLTSILLVQEQLLTFIPNVQFTTLLILLFVTHFTFKESMIMLLVYVFLDSLWMGALNPLIMVPMYLGWALIPMFYHTVLKRTQNVHVLALFGLFMGSLYGFVFVPFAVLQTGVSAQVYILADIPFQIVMGLSNFMTIYWLYAPLNQRFKEAALHQSWSLELTHLN